MFISNRMFFEDFKKMFKNREENVVNAKRTPVSFKRAVVKFRQNLDYLFLFLFDLREFHHYKK
jgi:hypothetical protein